jgi:L-amino acid N-acyltransferase YncA
VGTWKGAYRGLLPDEHLDAMDVARWTVGWQRVLAGERQRAATVVAVGGDGGVVGFVDVIPSRDDDAAPDTGEVTSIYVLPSAWGTGAGRALMAAAVDRLRENGYRWRRCGCCVATTGHAGSTSAPAGHPTAPRRTTSSPASR